MAQVIIKVSDLKAQLTAMTANVEAFSLKTAQAAEDRKARLDRDIANVEAMYDRPDEEWLELAKARMDSMNANKRWWQRAMTLSEAADQIILEEHVAQNQKVRSLWSQYFAEARPSDDLSPVHRYLLTMCDRLNPDDEIVLSERETYAFHRMMDLPDA